MALAESTNRRSSFPTTPTLLARCGTWRDDLGLRVTLVNPDYRNPSPKDLANAATYVKRLWKSHLRRSQFPHTMEDAIGAITKPPSW